MSNFEEERKNYQETGTNLNHLKNTAINYIDQQEETLKRNLIEKSDQKEKPLNKISPNNLTFIAYNFVGIAEVSFNLHARIADLKNTKDIEQLNKIPNLLEKCVDEYYSLDGDISQVAMEAVDNVLYNELEGIKQKQKSNEEEM